MACGLVNEEQGCRTLANRIRGSQNEGIRADFLPQVVQRSLGEEKMLSGLILAVIIGLIAGWLAGKVMKGGGYGTLMDIVLGIAGGVIGRFVFGLLGLSASGLTGSIIVSFVGAVILIWLVRQLKKA